MHNYSTAVKKKRRKKGLPHHTSLQFMFFGNAEPEKHEAVTSGYQRKYSILSIIQHCFEWKLLTFNHIIAQPETFNILSTLL